MLGLFLIQSIYDLVVPQPYPIITVREGNHVIKEWLALLMTLWGDEYLL
jgi:hypothetical protein